MIKKLRSLWFGPLVLLLSSVIAIAQSADEISRAQAAEQAARKAYGERSYGEFLIQMVAANAARPNHPRLIYNLAAAYALNGDPDNALNSIERLAKMGLAFAVEKDENFKGLVDNERFKAAMAIFATNREPLNKGEVGFSVDDKTLIAESLAFDPKGGSYYVGSIHQRKIVRIDRKGIASDFSKPSDGLWSVLGMRVDAARGFLWACTTAFPQMKGFAPEDKGRAGIFKYELATGRLLKKYILPSGESHALGDLILDKAGNVYATDSVAPVIYRIGAKSDTIEEFLRSTMFASLQGLAFDTNQRNLYLADYSKGIFRVDLSTKHVVQQTPTETITLLGIDGLYFYQGALIAIQNGVVPNRVLRLSLEKDQIVAQEVIEANHPDFNEPTLGVIVGDSLHFIANSQWPHVNGKAELTMDKLRPTVVLKLSLKRAAVK